MVHYFLRNLILTNLSQNKVLIFLLLCFSLAFYQGRIYQVNLTCHTYYCKKKIRRLVYLVLRAAFSCWSHSLIVLHCLVCCHAIPLHRDSKICDTVQSILRKIILTKIKLTCCNFLKVRTCMRHPLVVKTTRKLSSLVLYSYFKDGGFIKGCTKLGI